MAEIDGELLTSRVKPNQQLLDLLISLGLNPDKYSEVFGPVFQFFYLKDNKSHSMNASVQSYPKNYDFKKLEYEHDIIFIYPPYDYSANEIRIYPVVNSTEYKRKLRSKKLERIIQDETEEIPSII